MAEQMHRLGKGADRQCACGCGASLAGKRRDAKYASGSCRAIASKVRANPHGPEANAHRAAITGRTGDALRIARRRITGPVPSDRRIQFSKAVDAAAGLLAAEGWDEPDARTAATQAMTAALPNRLRPEGAPT